VTVRARSVRRPFRGRLAATPDDVDDRLAYLDQAMFLGVRAIGEESVMQCTWVYEHPVDVDGLRRFHRNFGCGLGGRRIEPSPLPFGRHRWVAVAGDQTDLDIAASARPRAELGDWLDERAQLPVDPEWGPTWHMGVQPFTDGSTGVTLVGSHCIADGGGALLTVFESVTGNTRDLGYPPPRSRTRRQAVLADLRQAGRDLPEVGRTLVAAAKMAVQRKNDIARSRSPKPASAQVTGDSEVMTEPAVTIFVDAAEWDTRASELGGNSYAMVAGFAAKLAERVGRLRASDGTASLIVPINDRSLEDSRANAVSIARVDLDPAPVTTDLSDARVVIRQALERMRETPDETLNLLPLIPFVPKRAVATMAGVAFGFADLPVSCTNLGALPAEISRVDGTEAEYVILRGVDRNITRRQLEQRRGLLTVVAARIGDRLSIAVIGYHPGEIESKAQLHEVVSKTLAEFGINGTFV
jgi:hypothetical protein